MGSTTFSLMTLGIMGIVIMLSIKTLRKMRFIAHSTLRTLSIMTFSITILNIVT